MILVTAFLSLLLSLIFLCIIKEIITLKKYWFNLFIITFLIINIFLIKLFNIKEIINLLIISGLICISFSLFLTLVFNDSPSIFLYQIRKSKNYKKIFINKKFVKDRLELMEKSNMIINKKLTTKGKITFYISDILSKILIK